MKQWMKVMSLGFAAAICLSAQSASVSRSEQEVDASREEVEEEGCKKCGKGGHFLEESDVEA